MHQLTVLSSNGNPNIQTLEEVGYEEHRMKCHHEEVEKEPNLVLPTFLGQPKDEKLGVSTEAATTGVSHFSEDRKVILAPS